VAPGFTREFFPILPEEPSAPARKGSARGDSGARASSSPVARPGGPDSGIPAADVSEGWISEPGRTGAGKR
jgi:hypothetical protein